MRFTRLHTALCGILIASIAVNILLASTSHRYYLRGKLQPVDPTFQEYYRSKNAAVLTADRVPLLVIFGDSRVHDWNPPPHVAGLSTLNRGIGGETTAQMVHRFGGDVIDLRPEAVVIQGGINDLVAAGLAPAHANRIYNQTVDNLASMVQQAKSADIRVVLLTITPPASPGLLRRIVWSSRIPLLVSAANQDLMRLHDPPRVNVLSTQALLQTSSGQWKPNVTADTLHLTPAGYKILNTAVQDVLARH